MKRNGTAYMLNLSNRLTDLVATQQHNLKGEVTHIDVSSMIKADSFIVRVTAFDKESKNECISFFDFLTEEELEQKFLIVEIALTTNESPSLKDFR